MQRVARMWEHPNIKLQSLQPSHRPEQMLQLAGEQRHPGAKAELLPKQIVLLYTCPFQQSSQLFQAVRMAHRVFKQFGCVLWIIIMSYSLSKPPTKRDSTHADLSDCSTHPVSWEYLWEVGYLLPKQGKKRKKKPVIIVHSPFSMPALLTSPTARRKATPSHPSHSSAPYSNTSAIYYQLIYCKDPFGLANTECKVTINVNC